MSALAAYGADLRPIRPGRAPRRSPVIKLGATEADQQVPGPGAYSPRDAHDSRRHSTSSWTIGKSRRQPTFEEHGSSPGPVYNLRPPSVAPQCLSARASAPRYGFGTEERLGRDRKPCTPGPGSYSPRVTCNSHTSQLSSPACGASERTLSSNAGGSWARSVQRSLATPGVGPGPMTYRPEMVRSKAPSYSIPGLGTRCLTTPGAEVSPGPAAYYPQAKSRRGGGHIGDSPHFSLTPRDEKSARFISKQHARTNQGKGTPSPQAYTPLEQLGITPYTVSNTSTHAPMYSFGSEARLCGFNSAR
ncbi:hypothetical protein AB1Y20_013198 [Prymnesium parvum]|uniref:Uncharacterized protein n=1 Tax=Prymnesium parvum TaxID=97485 RepID=A0AB34IL07_PRYPA